MSVLDDLRVARISTGLLVDGVYLVESASTAGTIGYRIMRGAREVEAGFATVEEAVERALLLPPPADDELDVEVAW